MGEPKFDRQICFGLAVILFVMLVFFLLAASRPGFFQNFSAIV
jgi:hypothetical protein